MRTQFGWISMLVAAASPWAGWAQTTVVTSLEQPGHIAWTQPVNTNAIFYIEWAANAGGPWYRTWNNQRGIDALSATSFAAEVPMFFRVITSTNPPPVGMVWIDEGEFEMGQTGVAIPVHTNYISGFWMDATEVTAGKWREVFLWATNNNYSFSLSDAGPGNDVYPKGLASWYDAVKWCNARSEMEGLTPVYRRRIEVMGLFVLVPYRTGEHDLSNSWVNVNANGYRLPTEAEWEKAARGGRTRKLFPWGGNTIQHTRANYSANPGGLSYDTSATSGSHPWFPTTAPVASFAANDYGLYDMAGNVSEWCWDWHGDYPGTYRTNPLGPESGSNRILRGGSTQIQAVSARCAARVSSLPFVGSSVVGFRCVRNGP